MTDLRRTKVARTTSVSPMCQALLDAIRTVPEHALPRSLDCLDHVLAKAKAESPTGTLPRVTLSKCKGESRFAVKLFNVFAGITAVAAIEVMNELRALTTAKMRAMGYQE